VNQIIKDCLTTANGEDFDVGRILLVIVIISFICYSGIDILYLKHTFNPMGYGTGAGGLLAGGGAGIGFKAKTEPQ